MKMNTNLLITFLLLFITSCKAGNNREKTSPSDAAGILESIRAGEDVIMEGKVIKTDLDLTSGGNAVPQHQGLNMVYVKGALVFRNCEFRGRLVAWRSGDSAASTACSFARNVSFINCIFQDEVQFKAANISGVTNFQGCTLLKGINMEEVTFGGPALFSKAVIRGEARFQNTVFRHKADFFECAFEELSSFQGAGFQQECSFNVARFMRYADFSLCQFQHHVFFTYAEAADKLIFNGSMFKGRCDFVSMKALQLEMKRTWFALAPRFDKAELSVSADISEAQFVSGLPDLGKMAKLDVEQLKYNNVRMAGTLLSPAVFMREAGLQR